MAIYRPGAAYRTCRCRDICTGILTYSSSKGAFIGASLNGAELQQDHKATKAWYGDDAPFKDILSGKVKTPNEEARAFVNAVQNAKENAQSH
jgi:lipid-binding SYLF domain-containing protein